MPIMNRAIRGLAAFLVVALCGVATQINAADLPPIPAPDYPLADDLAYPDAKAAQDAWQAKWGTAPVAVVRIGHSRALRMPCNFKDTKIERAAWDRKVKLDLTACQGIRFLLFSPDASPISHFSFYLHSGQGWYAAGFGSTVKAGWTPVSIDKTDMMMEGQPGGWGTIDAIRISAWRGSDTDAEFYIANLGLPGRDAPIAIIRGESVAATAPGEAESVSTYSKAMAQTLDSFGLPYVIISDLDVTAERLKGEKIVILPHNPQIPEKTGDILADFIQGGGKLLSFYCHLPPRLSQAADIKVGQHIRENYRGQFASIVATNQGLPGEPPLVKQMSWNISHAAPIAGRSRVMAVWFNAKGETTGEPAILASSNAVHMTHVLLADDLANKQTLVLAMLGHLAPELWEQAATNRVAAIGRFGPFNGFDEAAKAIRLRAAGKPAVTNALEEASRLRRNALDLAGERKFAEAIAKSDQAQAATVAAYCSIQEPKPGEYRAWWCHSAFGPAGMDWGETIKLLAANGFTAILPNMCWGGLAYYESSVLPVAPEVKERGDQIAKCLAACKKYGIQCHVWKVNWNMGDRAPREFAERMKGEGRVQVLFDGKPENRWLCPSHPANQQLEIDAMAEIAAKYDVVGIHFDYIRYPGPEGCFCLGCRGRFEKIIALKVADWPADTRNDDAIRRKWLDFRRDNITRVVAATAERVRKTKPGVKISAAVFANWPVDRDQVGQDWKSWCEKGYLDFVCPMDYTSNEMQFANQVSRQLGWAGKVPCYPGIGLSVWNTKGDIVKLIEYINITRRLNTGGFTIFEYDLDGATQVAPLCGKGITRKPDR